MHIYIVPILKDNYAYVIESAGQVAVIDPGEAKPIVDFLTDHAMAPDWIINTHKHGDHTAGNIELLDAYGCKLAAPAECGAADLILADGGVLDIGEVTLQCFHTPGHTAGHVILYEPNDKVLFSGDTLFAMGCGRVFEGTMAEMFVSMQIIKSLPPETRIYCGHEYTLASAEFAAHILPDNVDIQQRLEQVRGQACTIPTTLDQELKTNPFLIAETVEEFAEYRKAKDRF